MPVSHPARLRGRQFFLMFPWRWDLAWCAVDSLGDYDLDTVHLRACHVRCLLGFTSIVYANPAAIAIGRVVRVGGVRACAQSSNALAAALLSLRRYEA
jgi:hypothetical protein